MNKISSILVFIFAFLTTSIWAQNQWTGGTLTGGVVTTGSVVSGGSTPGTITGLAQDSITHANLSGVTVSYSGGTTTTNSSGVYSFSSVPVGTYSLTFSLPGYTSLTTGVSVISGSTTTRNVLMTVLGTGAVQGTVTDSSSHAGIPGAIVSYSGGSATTDVNGAYTLTGVSSGTYTFTASKTGYTPFSSSLAIGGGATVTFSPALTVIPPSLGSISGTVQDSVSHAALTGVAVSFSGGTTTTDSGGNYSFSNVPAGSYTLTFTFSGYTTLTAGATVTAGTTTTLNVSMVVGLGALQGTVTNSATHTALSGVSVSFSGGSTTTAPNGTYSITNITAGTYSVTFSLSGYDSVTQSATIVAGSTTTSNAALAVSHGTITGTVTNSLGANLSGATVAYSGGSTTTNGSGVYTLSNVPVGTYAVTVTDAGYNTGSQSVTVTANTTSTVNFTMTPVVTTGTLTGTVTNTSSAPLSGVTVSFSGGSTVTNSSGVYTIPNITAGTYPVTATLTGYDPVTQSATITAGGTTTSNFTLSVSHGTVSGVVTDSSSSPIAGATVSYTGGSTTTDSGGNYSFTGVVVGTYVFTASATGYNSQTHTLTVVANTTTTQNFSLVTTVTSGTVSGTVTVSGSGTGLQGVTVSYSGGSTITASGGTYTLSNVLAGTYTLTFSLNGYDTATQSVTVTAGLTTTANQALSVSHGTISGTVTNSSGTALSGATVSYSGGSTTTNSSGAYTLSSVVVGTYAVTVTDSGYNTASKSVTVTANTTTTANFSLTPVITTGTIVGTVTNAGTGAVLSGVTVSYSGGSTVTNTSGVYTLSNVTAGTYTLTFSLTGYDSTTQSSTVVAGSTTTTNAALSVSHGTISGTVTNASGGAPIVGATVSYSGGSTTTNGSGVYTFASVVVGTYTVTASATGFNSLSHSATVTSSTTTTVNFSMTAVVTTGTLTGTVTNSATGAKLAGAMISYSGGSATTNSGGVYTLSGITAGTYTFTVTLSGYNATSSSQTITAGVTTTYNPSLTVIGGGGTTVTSTYFGQHLNYLTHAGLTPWPTSNLIGAIRFWDMGFSWKDINTSNGVYNYTALDTAIADAQAKGVDMIYTFGNTPTWASSNPTDTTCAEGSGGACDPPASSTSWTNFVTAIVTHSAGRIHYWELWNEANSSQFWTGSLAQLVTQAQQAYAIIKSIDPTAVVLSPSGTETATQSGVAFMTAYLAAGGGPYMDVLAFHGYGLYANPEGIATRAKSYQSLLTTNGKNIPMIDTEYSWGTSTYLPAISDQVNFVARTYLLQWQAGVERAYWYAYDNQSWGTLWNATTGLNAVGTAYQQVYSWMVGTTMLPGACTSASNVYQCAMTRTGGYKALAVWNTSGTSTFTVPAGYVQYRDLVGSTTAIIGSTVSIGKAPILLENVSTVSGVWSPTDQLANHIYNNTSNCYAAGENCAPQVGTTSNQSAFPGMKQTRFTISSISKTSGKVTVTLAQTTYNFSWNTISKTSFDSVTISGVADSTNYPPGTYAVTGVTTNTLTYTQGTGSAAASSGGTAVRWQPAGHDTYEPSGKNVSNLPNDGVDMHNMIYTYNGTVTSATGLTKIMIHTVPFQHCPATGACLFVPKPNLAVNGSHVMVGYKYATATQVAAKLNAMKRLGADGTIIDWSGAPFSGASTTRKEEDSVTDLIASNLAGQSAFVFALAMDQTTYNSSCSTANSTQPSCTLKDMECSMDYAHTAAGTSFTCVAGTGNGTSTASMVGGGYFTSAAYAKDAASGRPIVETFLSETGFTQCTTGAPCTVTTSVNCTGTTDCWTKIWAALSTYVSSYAKPPLFFWRNSFTHVTPNNGTYRWINPTGDASNQDFSAYDTWINTASTSTLPVLVAEGVAHNDHAQSSFQNDPDWMGTECGMTWVSSMARVSKNNKFSPTHPIPWLQVTTWDDYEEGTALEPGILSCYGIGGSITGSTISYSLSTTNNTYAPIPLTSANITLDHITVLAVKSGGAVGALDTMQVKQLGVPVSGSGTVDVSTLNLPSGTYSFYVKLVSKPGITTSYAGPFTWTH